MPEHVVTVTYTEDIIRAAAKVYWSKTIGVNGFTSLALLTLTFFVWLFLDLQQWFVGFTGALLLVWAGIVTFSYFRFRNFSMARYREMNEKKATFYFSDLGVRSEADTGKMEIPWRMIDKVIEHPQFWLVGIRKSNFFTLPLDSVPPETKAFIREHIAVK